jgi:hypothetical protein
VIYTVRPSDGGFVAEWKYIAVPGEWAAKSHREEFASYADTLRYLEAFDEPLAGKDS